VADSQEGLSSVEFLAHLKLFVLQLLLVAAVIAVVVVRIIIVTTNTNTTKNKTISISSLLDCLRTHKYAL
jgi:hypothetical protein